MNTVALEYSMYVVHIFSMYLRSFDQSEDCTLAWNIV